MGDNKTSKMAKGKGKKKAKGTSNVFSMFEQSQIQEFKEAFGMIDANRDGFIDKEDLRSTYASLGVMSIENSKLDEMMAEAPAAINFTVFLNMLADKLHGTDSEDVILNAFKLFDPEGLPRRCAHLPGRPIHQGRARQHDERRSHRRRRQPRLQRTRLHHHPRTR